MCLSLCQPPPSLSAGPRHTKSAASGPALGDSWVAERESVVLILQSLIPSMLFVKE